MANETQTTVIGPDTHIKGEMTFEKSCQLLGTFEGTITAKGELQVAGGATCRAQVDAGSILVDGNIEGNTTARDKIQLNAKATITGDIVAAKLIVAEGASFSGHVSVGPEAVKNAPAAQTETESGKSQSGSTATSGGSASGAGTSGTSGGSGGSGGGKREAAAAGSK